MGMRLTTERLTAIADNWQLVTRRDVEDDGWARSAWGRAVRRQDLLVVADGVGILPGATITPEVRIAAAVRSAPGAAASHRSAAFLYGAWRSGDRPVDIIRPTGRDLAAHGCPVFTHRPVDRDRIQFVHRSGIPSTTPERTLIDFAGLRPRNVIDVMVSMRAAGLVTLQGITDELDRRSTNVPGAAATRRALEREVLRTTAPDSMLEARFAELAKAFDLPAMQHHAVVIGYEVDFLVIGTNVVIECDGFDFHGRNHEQFERDRRRDAELTAAGYRVIRVTWGMVCDRPASVARTIRAALRPRT